MRDVEIWASPDLETAIADGLWGWRFTAIAAAIGVAAAAEEPLPQAQEAKAQRLADGFVAAGLSSARLAPLWADPWARKALAAHRAALLLLQALQDRTSAPELLPETKKTKRAARRLNATERLGRAAAISCRINFLTARACDGPPQSPNRKSRL
jgi:hypothetical protein